jgi:hypothetical protein
MEKVIPSTTESDEAIYGQSSLQDVGFNIYMPESRRDEIARFLEIPSVYCVANNKRLKRGFVQIHEVDPRNNWLKYFEVKPEYYEQFLAIAKRPYTSEERAEGILEDEHNMELARRGLL